MNVISSSKSLSSSKNKQTSKQKQTNKQTEILSKSFPLPRVCNEFAKSRAIAYQRANVVYVPTCLRASVVYMLTYPRAKTVPRCQ